MFYSVYLAASFSNLGGSRCTVTGSRTADASVSARYSCLGSLQRASQRRSLRELGGAVGLIALWNYVAVCSSRPLWCALPMLYLIAAGCILPRSAESPPYPWRHDFGVGFLSGACILAAILAIFRRRRGTPDGPQLALLITVEL
jgi:hypothetical protein